MLALQNIPLETAISYVAAAYIGIWVILFGYLVVLGKRMFHLSRQVEALTVAVSAKKDRPAKAAKREPIKAH
jgi:CcmD family protein